MKTETVICTQDPPLKCFRMPPKSKGLWFHRSSCSEFIAFLLLSTQIHLTESASPCFTEIVSVKRPGSFQCLSTTIKDNYCGPQACSWNSTVCLLKKDPLWHSAVWLTTTSGFDWMWWVVHMAPNCFQEIFGALLQMSVYLCFDKTQRKRNSPSWPSTSACSWRNVGSLNK